MCQYVNSCFSKVCFFLCGRKTAIVNNQSLSLVWLLLFGHVCKITILHVQTMWALMAGARVSLSLTIWMHTSIVETQAHQHPHVFSHTYTHSLSLTHRLCTRANRHTPAQSSLLRDSYTTAPSFINSARTTGPGVSVPLQQAASGGREGFNSRHHALKKQLLPSW